MKLLAVIISLLAFSTPALACKKPSKSQLKRFFGKSNWSGPFGASLKLNFSNPKASVLSSIKGNATVTSFCLSGNTIHVNTNKGKATVTKSGGKLSIKPAGSSAYSFVNYSQPLELVDDKTIQRALYRNERGRFSADYYRNNAIYRAPAQDSSTNNGAIDI